MSREHLHSFQNHHRIRMHVDMFFHSSLPFHVLPVCHYRTGGVFAKGKAAPKIATDAGAGAT